MNSGAFQLIKEGLVEGYEGNAFAFTPDSRRYVYHDIPAVVVRTVDSAQRHHLTTPIGEYLARKGAWTPDGTAVVTVQGPPGIRSWRA